MSAANGERIFLAWPQANSRACLAILLKAILARRWGAPQALARHSLPPVAGALALIKSRETTRERLRPIHRLRCPQPLIERTLCELNRSGIKPTRIDTATHSARNRSR